MLKRLLARKMKISTVGLALIKHFEDFRSNSYKCPAGVWTIGYGHTKGVKEGQTIDEKRGEVLLRKDIAWAEKAVRDLVMLEIAQYQFDALVSFVFNMGREAFRTSTLLKYVNTAQFDLAADEFDKWVYSRGKALKGLIARREVEKELWRGIIHQAVADDIKAVEDMLKKEAAV